MLRVLVVAPLLTWLRTMTAMAAAMLLQVLLSMLQALLRRLPAQRVVQASRAPPGLR